MSAPPCQEIVWEGNDVDLAQAADPDLLARRRRPADHLGPDGHQRPAQDAPEPGHLPPAGDRPQQGDHALARASRRRARLPRVRARQSGQAVSGRRRAGRRSRPPSSARSRRCPTRCPNTSSPACCAAAAPNWRSASRRASTLQVPARAEIVLEGHLSAGGRAVTRPQARRRVRQGRVGALRACAGRPVRRPHRLLQRAGLVPGLHDRAHHDAARPDLPLHLHRQAARRAGRAGRRAERGVRAAAAKAVQRDHRLLSAARRLQLPDGDRADEEELRRPRQARDVRRVELPAPVHVYEVHRGGRRGRRTSATGRK